MEFVGLFLHKNKHKPLYMQLYEFLAAEIGSGHIAAGERLPGKRSAAQQLGVSVNTVDEAYQMLAAEGYLTAQARSGFVVNDLGPLVPHPSVEIEKITPTLASAGGKNTCEIQYNFLSGGIDSALFPRKAWNRLSKEVLSAPLDLFATGESQGDAVLRVAIADYLRSFRGVQCTPEQVVMGAGLEVLLGLLAPLLPRGAVALENPGYAKIVRVFQNVNRQTIPVDVDSHGLPVEAIQKSGANIVYLTPSHQFPTGLVMPVPRRAEILRWATQRDAFLIEDDYDSEFRFSGRPLPSLQGMDKHGRVVYAGTFSRSLAPGIRASYLVLPPDLLDAWQARYKGYACTIWRPEQYTLARFISEGHFARRLNQMRLRYRQRLSRILELLAQGLPQNQYEVRNIHTGLYFVLHLPGCDAAGLAKQASLQGIEIRALSHYRQENSRGFSLWQGGHDALVLGYGGLLEEHLDAATYALLALIKRNI